MANTAHVAYLLISSPSDIPSVDLDTVHRTIDQWNFTEGRTQSVIVQAMSWDQNASPQFGPPQNVINRQLVDIADMVLAVFGTRLGSPTETDESGTAEEIRRTAEAGKAVGILRNTSLPAPTDVAGVEQLSRLTQYLADLRTKALTSEYQTEAQLIEVVRRFLSQGVADHLATAQDPAAHTGESGAASDDDSRGVWPRIDITERQKISSKGRVSNQRSLKLMLRNGVGRPVQNVRASLEPVDGETGRMMDLRPYSDSIEVLPPDQEIPFGFVAFGMGMNPAARCVVVYEDGGVEQTRTATVSAL